MGSPTVADKIFEVFRAHPNVEVSLNQIRNEAGPYGEGGKGYTDNQIQSAISNLRNRGAVPIEAVVAGRVFRYEPGKVVAKSEAQLFELLATLKNGSLLLQDESGRIYRATELD